MQHSWKRTALVVFSMLVLALWMGGTASAQQLTVNCTGAMPARLIPGQWGRVTPGLPNILRTLPGQSPGSMILGQIPAGGVFFVLTDYAPQCYNGRLWWHVSYGTSIGWTPEAEVYGPYWAEPLINVPPPVTQPPPPVAQCQPTRLSAGGQGQVMAGSANALRSLPRRGVGSQIYLYIPSQGVFTVQSGYPPTCTDGVLWLYVSYAGYYGWTPESNAFEYWVTPYGGGTQVCNSGLPNRLVIGGRGIVLPGLPNSLRSQASLYSPRLGYIYAGETFAVLQGPLCDHGIPYYLVQTNIGAVGWTGEGQWGQYWVAPS